MISPPPPPPPPPPANLEDDYSLPNTLLKFPVGSVKGTKSCTEVTIYNDYLREGRETFSIEAVSTAALPVTFGSGRVGSLSVSVEVIIIDDDGKHQSKMKSDI